VFGVHLLCGHLDWRGRLGRNILRDLDCLDALGWDCRCVWLVGGARESAWHLFALIERRELCGYGARSTHRRCLV
jgi:hypothetical protein